MSVYHQILGVSEHSSVSEIKKAYRNLARQFHPDMNPAADAAEQFIKITEAYEILTGERKPPRMRIAATETRSYEDIVRERAKEYARMRYEDFKRRSDAYESIPMHKILWPKWVNFIFIAIALFFIIDGLLPEKKMECRFKIISNSTIEACGYQFSPSREHYEDSIFLKELDKNIELRFTPVVGYLSSYHIVSEDRYGFVSPMNSEKEYILAMYILIFLAVITLLNKTKKFENKLLIKVGMCIVFTAYAIVYFMWLL